MASEQAVSTVFAVLEAAGLPKPKMLDADLGLQQALATWVILSGGVPDDALVGAARTYCITPGGRFWPSLPQLLALIPKTAPPPQIEAEDRPGPYDLAPGWAREVVLDRWQPDPTVGDDVLQAQLDGLAAEVYPMHDPLFAALDEDGRWLHWLARRGAA